MNWYIYCANNPIRFIDLLGLYDREAAAKYAYDYAYSHNPDYLKFDSILGWTEYFFMYGVHSGYADCTNFTSQALLAGGISMNDDWHYYKTDNQYWIRGMYITPDWSITLRAYEYDFTAAWSRANSQFEYFKNPDNGYMVGDVLKLSTMEEMKRAVENGEVQIGDLMFFGDDQNVHHATMITGFKDGKILYSAHTKNRQDQLLEFKGESVFIIRICDDA